MDQQKNRLWTGICRERGDEEDKSKLGKGLLQRKRQNLRHGVRLRGWQRTESDGGALQKPYVPNGMKEHKSNTCCTLPPEMSTKSIMCSNLHAYQKF
jgi:hypothetical protein